MLMIIKFTSVWSYGSIMLSIFLSHIRNLEHGLMMQIALGGQTLSPPALSCSRSEIALPLSKRFSQGKMLHPQCERILGGHMRRKSLEIGTIAICGAYCSTRYSAQLQDEGPEDAP